MAKPKPTVEQLKIRQLRKTLAMAVRIIGENDVGACVIDLGRPHLTLRTELLRVLRDTRP